MGISAPQKKKFSPPPLPTGIPPAPSLSRASSSENPPPPSLCFLFKPARLLGHLPLSLAPEQEKKYKISETSTKTWTFPVKTHCEIPFSDVALEDVPLYGLLINAGVAMKLEDFLLLLLWFQIEVVKPTD